MTNEISLYEKARQALVDCKSVDEVKNIKDQAEAMRYFAKRTKNRDLLIYAVEIQARSERRLGEMIIEAKERGEISHGHKGKNSPGEKSGLIKLEDLGVTTELSSHAQRLARYSEPDFEKVIGLWCKASASGDHVTVDMLAYAERVFPRDDEEDEDEEDEDEEEDEEEDEDEDEEEDEDEDEEDKDPEDKDPEDKDPEDKDPEDKDQDDGEEEDEDEEDEDEEDEDEEDEDEEDEDDKPADQDPQHNLMKGFRRAIATLMKFSASLPDASDRYLVAKLRQHYDQQNLEQVTPQKLLDLSGWLEQLGGAYQHAIQTESEDIIKQRNRRAWHKKAKRRATAIRNFKHTHLEE